MRRTSPVGRIDVEREPPSVHGSLAVGLAFVVAVVVASYPLLALGAVLGGLGTVAVQRLDGYRRSDRSGRGRAGTRRREGPT